MPPSPTPAIAVHLHIFYEDMWDTIQYYLKNLEPYPYRLYVTMVRDNPVLKGIISSFHSETEFFVVENRGYDIGPFVHFLNQIDLNDFDFILKIHTKNDQSRMPMWCNILYISRWQWTHLLLGAVLKSKAQVKKNIEMLLSHPGIGMIGAHNLIIRKPVDMPNVVNGAKEILEHFGYQNQHYEFVAGTMFIARSAIFQKIKDNFTIADFEITGGSGSDGTLAHILERVLGGLTIAQGYQIAGTQWSLPFSIMQPCGKIIRLWNAFVKLVYKKKITTKNRVIIKLFKIPILYYSLDKKAK